MARTECRAKESSQQDKSMDLTIPYTLYPSALSHGLSWALFIVAVLASLVISVAVARAKKPWLGLFLFVPVLIGLLIVTIVCSMVVTFFTHDV
jgi:hypothetical protein